MTPLIDYLVRYGRKGSTPEIMATMDNVTTHYILFSDNGENLEVGVASRNSAGYSQFTSIVVSAGKCYNRLIFCIPANICM